MTRTLLLALTILAGCAHAPPTIHPLAAGVSLRNAGEFQRSIELLTAARDVEKDSHRKALLTGELGASLLAARRLPEARAQLTSALVTLVGVERARYLLDMGNLALAERRHDEARAHFQEALGLGSGDALLRVTAQVQLSRLFEPAERAGWIQAAAAHMPVDAPGRLHLNLGARALELGSLALEVADEHLASARRIALAHGDIPLLLEAADALSQRFEDADRFEEASTLVDEALGHSAREPAGIAGLARVHLLWRQARLAGRLKQHERARAAYMRAVDEIETLRPDIPIEYEDGQSSFRKTLAPIYLGLAESLLHLSSGQQAAEQAQTLRRVRGIVELLKQSELQDYLGDRCVVESDRSPGVSENTAILYPIIFADRLELVVETSRGIGRFTSRTTARTLTRVANEMASAFRHGPRGGLNASRQLYDWLVRPIEALLAAESIATLVIVPDGVLRLVPVAALHDGERFLVEKLAVATIPGLTMTNVAPPARKSAFALLAGLSEPGPVVDRLPQNFARAVLGAENTRSPSQLREALSLPGVKREIEELSRLMPSDTIMDRGFTAGQFERQLKGTSYQVVHVASHGVFGGSASESFIMTYDELLTMDRLQSLLGESAARQAPVELLTLSACETAEGDDRSPLGISGAALKARAKSAIGTLWPVEDTAAEKVMQAFYTDLRAGNVSKAEALRRAQLQLLRDSRFEHPFFWAPFIVVGNWL